MSDSAHLPAYTEKSVKDQLIANGASGTIYAFAFPESRQILEEILDGGNRGTLVDAAVREAMKNFSIEDGNDLAEVITKKVNETLAAGRQEYTDIFEGAWTARQDHVDTQFFDAWRKWSAPVVTLDHNRLKHQYPTVGASEGLRECINHYSICARLEKFEPTIHIFAGEYEGFDAYAKAAGIAVVKHSRNDWKNAISKIGPHDQFYLSQPSAIDGNVWDDFDDFAQALYKEQPSAKLMLDLTYVGSVAKEFNIHANHPNIPTVFFSLSKPFGVYYHRIGGLLTSQPMDSLFGNKWFKNLQAIRFGTALLERSTPYDLPQKYEPHRMKALETISRNLGINLRPSDVILFATADGAEADNDLKQTLLRGADGHKFMRVCITPELARIVPGGVYIDNNGHHIKPPSAILGPAMKGLTP